MTFGEILVKKKIVSNNLFIQSKKEAEDKGVSLDEVLLKHDILESDILQAKSETFNMPIRKLSSATRVPIEVLKNIPEQSARHYKFVPLGIKDGIIEVGIVDPDDMRAREALQFLSSRLNLPFRLFLISLSDLRSVLKDYKSLGVEEGNVLGELETVI